MLDALSLDDARRIVDLARRAAAARDRLVGGMRNIELGDQFAERGSRNPTDLDTLKVIDAAGGDAAFDALKETIQGLSPEARHEAKGLLLVGRGDFTREQWDEALDEAARTPASGDVDFLTDRGTLSQDLMKGLYTMGCL